MFREATSWSHEECVRAMQLVLLSVLVSIEAGEKPEVAVSIY